MNQIPSYLLLFDGSGAPVLSQKNLNKNSTQTSDSAQNNNEGVYLVGGFSSYSHNTGSPVSPTLKLNGDLGIFSHEKLEEIGRAELNRLNSTPIKSYIFELEKRILAVASSPEKLTDFLETYSGVLQIEPLLIGNYSPDYNSTEDLVIKPLPNGCNVKYGVRSQVDLERCNYCGKCGPVCPEDCLDENLFINLPACTYCNECVKICPEDAIDLYRAENFDLDFPAVLLLDKVKIELPPNQSHIFQADELEKLFSRFVPLNIEETVAWNSSICQYSSKLGVGCTMCEDACQHSAIELNNEGVAIDHQICVECGSCLAVCPTGSLQYKRFTDQQFIDWFAGVRFEKDSSIIIGSEKELQHLWWKKHLVKAEKTLFLEHPNVMTLTSMHLLFLLSLGAQKIILLVDPEKEANNPFANQVKVTNNIFSSLFGINNAVVSTSSNELKNLLEKSDPHPFQKMYSDFSFSNRRKKLRSILTFLIDQSQSTGMEFKGEEYKGFGSVKCNSELCTHCGACLNECRIGALHTEEETLTLFHKAIMCVQCNTCVDVCPENALTLDPGLKLSESFCTDQVLTKAEPVSCLECGKPFGTKKSFERIVAILKAKSPDDFNVDLLAYCEKCRVVKMFEENQQ